MNLDPAAARADSRLSTMRAAGLIVVITLAVYWPALGSGFVGDDFMILHRLRALAGPADVFRFFRGEFFEYYRPLGFVSHAVDFAIAGQNARQFHLTNLLIHIVNALLVLLIGRSLSPRSLAGPLAAILFALHPSNNEAVIWMSARFDLLATGFGLAAVCWMVRGWIGGAWMPAILFFPALLSKEAAVALPLAPAGWSTYRVRGSTIATIARVAPWLLILGIYSALRQFAGGVSAVGGASRLAKLAAFGLSLAAMSRAADELVQRGLMDRTEDPSDRRMKRLKLTDEGRDLVQKMRELRMAGFEQFVATLSPKERTQLAKALEPILKRDEVVAFCGGKK